MSDNFIEMAETRLRELKERDTHLESTERGIAEQRRALAADIERIQSALSVFRDLTGAPSTELPGEQRPLSFGNLKDMTIADGCESIMSAQGGEADVTMLVRALMQAGKLKAGSAAYGSVVNTLKRLPTRFWKVRPGRWALVSDSGNEREVQTALLR